MKKKGAISVVAWGPNYHAEDIVIAREYGL
jgi:hypothetical protein